MRHFGPSTCPDVIVPMPPDKRSAAGVITRPACWVRRLAELEDSYAGILCCGWAGCQSEQRGRERSSANVQGIFRLNEDHIPVLGGAGQFLLDDIVTSGATMTRPPLPAGS